MSFIFSPFTRVVSFARGLTSCKRLDFSSVWQYLLSMLKFTFNLACLALIVWVALSLLGMRGTSHKGHKGHRKAPKVEKVVVTSVLPQDIVGDIVAEIAGKAASNVATSLDTMIQNEGNRMIESGSKNVEREVQNIGRDVTDSLQSGMQSQINNISLF